MTRPLHETINGDHPAERRSGNYGFPEDRIKRGEYPDDGCNLHPACLSCPRPLCKYDDDPHDTTKRTRHTPEVIRLKASGKTVAEICRTLPISSRTVHRILQAGGPAKTARRLDATGRLISKAKS